VYNELKGMSNNNEHKVSCKVWLELRGEPLIGKGGAKILETIKQVESISNAAKTTGMSYRYIWNYLSKLERRLGEPVVTTFKGGNKGGGGAKLTRLGIKLLDEYKQAEFNMANNVNIQTSGVEVGSENHLKGTILEIAQKDAFANIKIITKAPAKLTLTVPKESVAGLNLQPADLIDVTLNTTITRITKENKD
jgi:molybdate transport system regulatory protein